jgi:hypothetical protein
MQGCDAPIVGQERVKQPACLGTPDADCPVARCRIDCLTQRMELDRVSVRERAINLPKEVFRQVDRFINVHGGRVPREGVEQCASFHRPQLNSVVCRKKHVQHKDWALKGFKNLSNL